jgi:hypothetical protein
MAKGRDYLPSGGAGRKTKAAAARGASSRNQRSVAPAAHTAEAIQPRGNSAIPRQRHHVGHRNRPWRFLGLCFPYPCWREAPASTALGEVGKELVGAGDDCKTAPLSK